MNTLEGAVEVEGGVSSVKHVGARAGKWAWHAAKKLAARSGDRAFFRSIQGQSLKAIERRAVDAGWKRRAAEGNGWRYLDRNKIERIRYMYPESGHVDWERMKQGYLRWTDEVGRYLDWHGSVVDPDDLDFAFKTHVPYEGIHD
jgi:hypothetical protein